MVAVTLAAIMCGCGGNGSPVDPKLSAALAGPTPSPASARALLRSPAPGAPARDRLTEMVHGDGGLGRDGAAAGRILAASAQGPSPHAVALVAEAVKVLAGSGAPGSQFSGLWAGVATALAEQSAGVAQTLSVGLPGTAVPSVPFDAPSVTTVVLRIARVPVAYQELADAQVRALGAALERSAGDTAGRPLGARQTALQQATSENVAALGYDAAAWDRVQSGAPGPLAAGADEGVGLGPSDSVPPAPGPTNRQGTSGRGSEVAGARKIAVLSLFGILLRDRIYPLNSSPQSYLEMTGNPTFVDARGAPLSARQFGGPTGGDRYGSMLGWAMSGADPDAYSLVGQTWAEATGQAARLYAHAG